MKYSDLTDNQKEVRSKEWGKVLDTYCKPDFEDSRPCDYGSSCERCNHDFSLNLKYVKRLKELNQPLLEEELHKFGASL